MSSAAAVHSIISVHRRRSGDIGLVSGWSLTKRFMAWRISHRSPDQQGLYQPVAIDQIERHIAGMTVRETVWFRETQEFAKALNHGQVDKAGAPYRMHLERVATVWSRALPPEKKNSSSTSLE